MCMCIELTLLRNRGELAEGWYEPETLRKAQASSAAALASRTHPKSPIHEENAQSGDLSDDDVGPALPRGRGRGRSSTTEMATSQGGGGGGGGSERHGPAIPSLEDLELRRGMHACMLFALS